MNFKRLKYFVEIVDKGSLTSASASLYIAQPALSQQLACLEAELDQKLFIRNKSGVTPTAAGQLLYQHARTILALCDVAQQSVAACQPPTPSKGALTPIPTLIAC